ncbi:MAG: hypothetical protein K6B14_09220 [Lachnospiraceae bacterium]|nr:hypothetical protein [Lachnospiraceae bacterium]
MKKRLSVLFLALSLIISMLPAVSVQADEPDMIYYTVIFDGFDNQGLKPLATGEKPYNGQIHVFDYQVNDLTYGLFVNYDGYYGDVADRIFYDEDSNELIIGTTGASDLKKFCVELHTSSTGTINDGVRVGIDGTRYSFDSDGRVYFEKAPSDLRLDVRMSPPAAKKSTKKINKSKTYNGSCKVKVTNYAKYVVLSGNDAGLKKINAALKKEATKFMKDSMVHEYASEQVRYGTYDDTYMDYYEQKVSFMNDEVVSISTGRYWYAGGVSNTFVGGVTFDLKTGKRIKDITEFTKEQDIKVLRKQIKKKIDAQKQGYETAEILKMKATQFDFYINKSGSVTVCFGPYDLGFGGWSKTCKVPGRY